ncbi:hypothetical protein E2C06_29535 [Dankookia rubra]|uniref:Uncharacterized protein n=1 Tax=Dankookia rubra TaxID=1442381 RepID=A0A4R5Q7X7_9PROT|nr:hypothetical protein [Dankookia rubra]TDH59032.1 hypothetical protein E2C06_29535 [Dankookia rubra]
MKSAAGLADAGYGSVTAIRPAMPCAVRTRTARRQVECEGLPPPPEQGGLGDVAAAAPGREDRFRGACGSLRPLARLETDAAAWPDRTPIAADAIIRRTGFRPAPGRLAPLGLAQPDERVVVGPVARALAEPRLFWLLGYGNWTGLALATLAGVTRAMREAAQQVAQASGRSGTVMRISAAARTL